MPSRAFALLVALALAGCRVDTVAPGAARIRCAVDGECPDGLRCLAAQERCVPSGLPCVEATASGLAPVADGNRCALEGGADGICRAAACVASRCGDGFVDRLAAEECDDGNLDDSDACPSTCRPASCGDGFVQTGAEGCDDGNTASGDGCRGDCAKREVCGDGERDEGEACDDGNLDDTDNCTPACEDARCGDAIRQRWEACDDGNAVSGDGCSADCAKGEVCGDGFIDPREECDDANANPNDACHACKRVSWEATARIATPGASTAAATPLALPRDAAVDLLGNVYLTENTGHRVLRIAPDGSVTVLAGTGTAGFGGDGEPAALARLNGPAGVAVDGHGNVYVADSANHRVRRVDARTGVITTVAGTGKEGFAGDGEPAAWASLRRPMGVAVDGLGHVFIADSGNHRLRRVDPATGLIDTVAGTGAPGFLDANPALAAQLNTPESLAWGGDALYVADRDNHRIRRLAGGALDTVAGSSLPGFAGDGGDAKAATLSFPHGVAWTAEGDLLVADTFNQRIRRVRGGVITTIAGSGQEGFAGDGGPALEARLFYPRGVSPAPGGGALVVDTGNLRVRRLDPADGALRPFAGSGLPRASVDGRRATTLPLTAPAIALDLPGRLLVADGVFLVRVDLATGMQTVLAGTGNVGSAGDGGPAREATLMKASGVAADAEGHVYVADAMAHVVRRVDAATGTITTFAGTGVPGYAGDGGPALSARLSAPTRLLLAPNGDLLVVDSGNWRVRRVERATGVITTAAGMGSGGTIPPGFGDGGDAASAHLQPAGLALDAQGNLFIADLAHDRVRRVDALTRKISTVAGGGDAGGDGTATAVALVDPEGVAVRADGTLLVAEAGTHRIREVDLAKNTISTALGGAPGAGGDGGPAAQARFRTPSDLLLDPQGNLFVNDRGNGRVRRVDAANGGVATVAGAVFPVGDGPLASAALAGPRGLAEVALGGRTEYWLADAASGRVRAVELEGATLRTVAGYPEGFEAEDAPALFSRTLRSPDGIAADPATGLVYVSEREGHAVRVVDTRAPAPTIRTLAGAAQAGFEDGPFASARFSGPAGVALDLARRRLYVADAGNHVVRAIHLDALSVSTVAGTPRTRGFLGDGTAATAALLDSPSAVALDDAGNLYVADTGNHRVRRVAFDGTIETILGDGSQGWSGAASSPARSVPTASPAGLAFDTWGNLFVAGRAGVQLVAAGATRRVDGGSAVFAVHRGAERAGRCFAGLHVRSEAGATRVLALDACTGELLEIRPRR